jgi:hypothetical protein
MVTAILFCYILGTSVKVSNDASRQERIIELKIIYPINNYDILRIIF